MITLETDDSRTEFTRIKELGAEVIAGPYQPSKDHYHNTWMATFTDPDGNYLQLSMPWKN